MKTRTEENDADLAPPHAASLAESLRAFGYELPTALADLADNSLFHNARHIEICFHWAGEASAISLADDGTGITEVPPVPVTVENGIGAGDAFGGALCHGLLEGWDTARTIRYANAAGAIVASRLACSDAMPTTDEIDDLLGEEDNAD